MTEQLANGLIEYDVDGNATITVIYDEETKGTK